VLVFDVR